MSEIPDVGGVFFRIDEIHDSFTSVAERKKIKKYEQWKGRWNAEGGRERGRN